MLLRMLAMAAVAACALTAYPAEAKTCHDKTGKVVHCRSLKTQVSTSGKPAKPPPPPPPPVPGHTPPFDQPQQSIKFQ